MPSTDNFFAPLPPSIDGGLGIEFTEDIESRVVKHKKSFYTYFQARYLEMLPLIFKYEGIKNFDAFSFEMGLRGMYSNNLSVAFGKNKLDKDVILGTVKGYRFNNQALYYQAPLTEKDISFTLPKALRLDKYQEITEADGCATGNFIIVQNKKLNLLNDMSVIQYYLDELCEIEASRYSLLIQAKISTFLIGDVNDETINQIANSLFNGAGYIKTTALFDPKENIYQSTIANLEILTTLKEQRATGFNNLNNYLGLNSVGIEKESGVSDNETDSNNDSIQMNRNVYLSARKQAFDKYNVRFGTKIEVSVNFEVVNKLLQEGSEDNGKDNNDPVLRDKP